MKRKTLYFLVILILALFTVNIIVKINSYALIRSQKTDKGVKFNNNGKIEYLDVGIDKIKFNFEQKKYDDNDDIIYFIDIYNGSQYPIMLHSDEISFSFQALDKNGEIYNFNAETYLVETMRPMENKKTIINYQIESQIKEYIKVQNLKFEKISYMIFKDDLLYYVFYDYKEDTYITHVSKPSDNSYVKANKEGVEFYIDDKKVIVDVTIDDFELNTKSKPIKNNSYYSEFRYKNKSKYPILGMLYYLSKNPTSISADFFYSTPVLPNEESPIKKRIDRIDFSKVKSSHIYYVVLKNDMQYMINYDFILDRYTLIGFVDSAVKKLDNGLELKDRKNEGKKEYLDFDIDKIEFITPNIDKTNKYIITKDTTIKNNSKYPVQIDLILKNKKNNHIVDYVYVEDNLILFNEESKIEIEEDSYDIDDENIEKLDEEYEILQIECDLYIDGKNYEIKYTPKLDLYEFLKFG